MRRLLWPGLAAVTSLAAMFACVGDDPAGNVQLPDAGTPPGSDGGGTDAPVTDAPSDGATARCNPEAAFGKLEEVVELNSNVHNASARLSRDERTVYWHRVETDDAAPGTRLEIWSATRAGAGDTFSGLAPVTSLAKPVDKSDSSPALLPDGALVFDSTRGTNPTSSDLWIAAPAGAGFATPQLLANLADPSTAERHPYPSSDGKQLWLAKTEPVPLDGGGTAFPDRVAVALATAADSFGAPQMVDLHRPSDQTSDTAPVISTDLRSLYFASDRDGNYNVYVAKHAGDTGPFDPPTPVAELNTPGVITLPSWLSEDGCVIYLGRGAPARIYRATRGR